VRACFVAAAIFVGGRVASRKGGRACFRAFSRPPCSLAADVAPFARARLSWRPSLLCACRWHMTVLGRGCGGRRAASPLWRPLCAQAAAFRLLPTRTVERSGRFAAGGEGVGLCKDRPLRQHGSSRAASARPNGAPARTAAVLPFVPTHAGRRRRLSPMSAILPVSVGGAHSAHVRGSSTSSWGRGVTTSSCAPSLARSTAFTTSEPASSRPASPRVAAAADAAAKPAPQRTALFRLAAASAAATKPAPPRPTLFRLAAASAAAAKPAPPSTALFRLAAASEAAAKPPSPRPGLFRLAAASAAAVEPASSRPAYPRLAAGTVPAAKPAPPKPELFRLEAGARAASGPHSRTPAVSRLAATAEPTFIKRTPYPLPAVTVLSGEPPWSRCVWVRLAAAPGAAAKPTPSRSSLRNPAAVAGAAAGSSETAASRTICVDVAIFRAIQSAKSLGASAATNSTCGRGGSAGATGAFPQSAQRGPDGAMAAEGGQSGLPGGEQVLGGAAAGAPADDTRSPAASSAAAGGAADRAAPEAAAAAADRRADGDVEAPPSRSVAGRGYNLVAGGSTGLWRGRGRRNELCGPIGAGGRGGGGVADATLDADAGLSV